jgi:hypothetical protein
MLIMKKLRIHFAGFVLLLTIMVVGVIGFNKALDEQENDAFNVMTFEKNRLEGGDIAKAQETGQWSDSPVITGTGDVTGTPTKTLTLGSSDGWVVSGGSGEPSGLRFKHYDGKGESLYSTELPIESSIQLRSDWYKRTPYYDIDTNVYLNQPSYNNYFLNDTGQYVLFDQPKCTCDCKQCKKCERK